MQEDAPINTLVMTVQARDGDRGMPRKVVYELLSSKSNKNIRIDKLTQIVLIHFRSYGLFFT